MVVNNGIWGTWQSYFVSDKNKSQKKRLIIIIIIILITTTTIIIILLLITIHKEQREFALLLLLLLSFLLSLSLQRFEEYQYWECVKSTNTLETKGSLFNVLLKYLLPFIL